MFFDILTLFPDMFNGPFSESIIKKARERGLVETNFIDIREYTEDKHHITDDYSYGGGAGMVMKIEPVYRAWQEVCQRRGQGVTTILFTPQGQKLDQDLIKEFSHQEGYTLICGHYEGIDERIRENIVDKEISIGDFVLTGGELPAMVFVDAVARMIPGVLGDEDSMKEDSFYHGLLDYPHYTRPREFNGMKVPDILLSGDHGRIEEWRRQKALKRTFLRRPDLIREKELTEKEKELLKKIKQELEGKNDGSK